MGGRARARRGHRTVAGPRLARGRAALLAVAVRLARGTCPWSSRSPPRSCRRPSIVSAWQDAAAGTVVNLLLLVVAGHAWARTGPRSLRADYARHVEAALAPTRAQRVVTEEDLAAFPEAVARQLRRSGAVGRPAVAGFRASIRGRIRGGPTKPWMPFTGEQVNVYGPDPCRIFFMDATMMGLPVDVLHVFDRTTATMRVRLASVVPIVKGAGPEMDRSETVTVLNDLASSSCRPSSVPRSRGRLAATTRRPHRSPWATRPWQPTSSSTRAADSSTVSDDRLRSSADGRTFTQQRWSTPVRSESEWDGRRLRRGRGALARARPGGHLHLPRVRRRRVVADRGVAWASTVAQPRRAGWGRPP